jgi:excisionase family DNA binding protein
MCLISDVCAEVAPSHATRATRCVTNPTQRTLVFWLTCNQMVAIVLSRTMSVDTTMELLSVNEVAARLGVTTVTVRRWIGTGQLAATKLGDAPTSPLRIPRVSVENFLVNHTVIV